MRKFSFVPRRQSAADTGVKPKPAAAEETGGNLAELELLRGELRSRSDELRNTTVKETPPKTLPAPDESGAEYTALINIDDRKTVRLGADRREGRLLAAANPSGKEISHKDERFGFSSAGSGIGVTSVLPAERGEFTLSAKAADNSKKRDFLETAGGDPVLSRCSKGAISGAAREIYSKNDERTAGIIKEMKGATPREDTALNSLSSLAEAVGRKSGEARRSVQKETRRILNSISVRGAPADDFFDFLRRRRGGEPEAPEPENRKPEANELKAHEPEALLDGNNDTITKGIADEEDY